METEQIYHTLTNNPVFQLATTDGDQPRTRNILLYKADAEGIVFHTAKFKDLFNQLEANAKVEMCFWDSQKNVQIRLSGEAVREEDAAQKQEIVSHPSRAFLSEWVKADPLLEGLAVYRMKNPSCQIWTMETNFEPKKTLVLE